MSLFDCDLLCPTKLLLAKPRHEGHEPTNVLERCAEGNRRVSTDR